MVKVTIVPVGYDAITLELPHDAAARPRAIRFYS